MHHHFFIINGYGTPDDIFSEEDYRFYLKSVFNHVVNETQALEAPQESETKTILLFSGGPTSMTPPYNQTTEAEEMKRYVEHLVGQDFTKSFAKQWELWTEPQALSTLENLLFCHEQMNEYGQKEGLNSGEISVTIFGEWTRKNRLTTLAQIIFKELNPQVVVIDFQHGPDRYLSPTMLQAKEENILRHDLWALENESNRAKHHAAYEEKLRRMRSGELNVARWFEENAKRDMTIS